MKIVLLLLLSVNVFAHGEDQFGPHKGYIRMPGAFHVELVPGKNNTFKVYLLDINWKNPSIEKSQLTIVHKDKTDNAVSCVEKSDYYLCSLPKNTNLKSGTLLVDSSYKGLQGMKVSYILPLTIKSEAKDAHKGHH